VSLEYLEFEDVSELHFDQIEEYGGSHGVRDEGLIRSAVARPMNKAAYEGADLAAQAAALLYGLAKNHGYVDGNKRVALAAASTFLRMNGHWLNCDNDTAAAFVEDCNMPSWTEDLVEQFVRRYVQQN
jgi:death-on-curing protein